MNENGTNADWLSIEQLAGWLNISLRSARRRVADVPPDLKRAATAGEKGRRSILYSRLAFPEILIAGPAAAGPAAAGSAVAGPAVAGSAQAKENHPPIAPDDLALAQLRVEACLIYIGRKSLAGEKAAARQTVEDYKAHPRTRQMRITERLPGGHERARNANVRLGGFGLATLRGWAAKWETAGRDLAALAPARKGRSGRPAEDVPEQLVRRVLAWLAKSPRADLPKALAAARTEWPGDWPEISVASWARRINKLDASGAIRILGASGVAEFRARHSPVIERDYSNMGYNELWELDDVTMDFYGYNTSLERLVRPKAYAIIRVATREWISVTATETPIVKDQVRSLLGLALASPHGGLPAAIRFERGATACDAQTEEILSVLGIKVQRTSMDGGKKHAGAFEEHARGHFQGKGVVESNIRQIHGVTWDALLQVGTEERHSAPQNLEPIKDAIIAAARKGQIIPELRPEQWQAGIAEALKQRNNTPHTGLARIVDAEASAAAGEIKMRHMTPAELGAAKRPEVVPVMDEKYLPLFMQRGYLVEVNKNGFTLNGFSYGRYDEGLVALAGQKVTAFACPEDPRMAFVVELGRGVEAYRAPEAGAEGGAIELKRGIEARTRNQYEKLMAEMAASGSRAVVERTQIISGMIQNPKCEVRRVAVLDERTEKMRQATDKRIKRQRELDARFAQPDVPEKMFVQRRRGLLSKGEDYAEQVAFLEAGVEFAHADKFAPV